MLTLIEGGELYAPEPAGVRPVLLAGERVMRIGTPGAGGGIDARAARTLDPDGFDALDARGCLVVPGFVDPHAHLIGAGGEQGFASRMPEITWRQFAAAGVTTAVGCLGTDAVTRHLSSLLAKARQLDAQGLTAFIYTGSFQVPPPTLTGSVTGDLVLIDKVIGVAELAVADVRSSQPSLHELARVVSDAAVGGMIGGKAGVTHVHVGPSAGRLKLLHALLDEPGIDVEPRRLYPTHVTRSRELLDDAVALARRGAYVDTDTVEPDTAKWLPYYLEHGGPPERFTFSSDAHTPGGTPDKLYRTFVACVRDHGLAPERALPHFSTNAAAALGLAGKGRVREGGDADLLVVRKGSLELRHVIARGRVLVREGRVADGPGR